MSLPAAPRNYRSFDEIYAKVAADQVARLTNFRRSHPLKRRILADAPWANIACGRGEHTLLLLPGALSIAESNFPLITALESEYRIIAPSYTLSLTMADLCDGIAGILEAEGVDQAHVMGGSYGGLVAQYFARRHPARVRSLILSHTFVLTRKYAKPLWLVGKLAPALPEALFVPLLKLRLDKLLLSKLRKANHPEAEFWRAYLNEAVTSDLLKKVFIHQNNCLLGLAQEPQFTSEDLKDWPGKILIIESEDDPAISASHRALLKGTYPQARVHTFTDAGHASSILKRAEVISLIRRFLDTEHPEEDCE